MHKSSKKTQHKRLKLINKYEKNPRASGMGGGGETRNRSRNNKKAAKLKQTEWGGRGWEKEAWPCKHKSNNASVKEICAQKREQKLNETEWNEAATEGVWNGMKTQQTGR